MHTDVSMLVTNRSKKSIPIHKKANKISGPSFDRGDYVLVRPAVDRGHKLQYMSVFPLRVEQLHNPLVYSVAIFNGTNLQRVHAARLIRCNQNFKAPKFQTE